MKCKSGVRIQERDGQALVEMGDPNRNKRRFLRRLPGTRERTRDYSQLLQSLSLSSSSFSIALCKSDKLAESLTLKVVFQNETLNSEFWLLTPNLPKRGALLRYCFLRSLSLRQDVRGDSQDKDQTDERVALEERLVDRSDIQLRRGAMLVNQGAQN